MMIPPRQRLASILTYRGERRGAAAVVLPSSSIRRAATDCFTSVRSTSSSSLLSWTTTSTFPRRPPQNQSHQPHHQRGLASTASTTLQSPFQAASSSSSSSLHHRHPYHPPAQHHHSSSHDRLLIVGSGVAGSAAALIAAETYRIPVTLLFAGSLPTDCNSYWAQGGIIYQGRDHEDSPALLAADIHRAGAGLCYDPAVQKVAQEGPERVRQLLLNLNHSSNNNHNNHHPPFAHVPFDVNPDTGELALCLEASHSAARILHQADHTGRIITQHITQAVARHPLITLQPSTIVTDITVVDNMAVGVETLQPPQSSWSTTSSSTSAALQSVTEYATRGIVLASGGLAGIYQHSTNPTGFNALGSSVALAVRAGLTVQDLEFVQFHPTALCLPHQAPFLLTEALRGEGAILRDAQGRAFAREYHVDGELAPRDVVARAVFAESQKTSSANPLQQQQQQQHNVFLDITHRDPKWLHQRFPTIAAHLQQHGGLDLARDQLPIVPAAHYTCGGVATDLHGCTSLDHCYAAGEAARTGLHGGNRLASTSLLEGLVFGASVADHAAARSETSTIVVQQAIQEAMRRDPEPDATTEEWSNNDPIYRNQDTPVTAAALLREVRRVMWDHVGVTRTIPGLAEEALPRLTELRQMAAALHSEGPTRETAAVRDATCAGVAVAQAALANRHSVGAHFLVDEDDEANSQVHAATTISTAGTDSDSDDEAEVAMAR